MSQRVVFLDTEFSADGKRLLDVGAIDSEGRILHEKAPAALLKFLKGADVAAGHNIVEFDAPMLAEKGAAIALPLADTLFLSSLLFPNKPYHRLIKNDKIDGSELNNPVADAQKSRTVFDESLDAYARLDPELRRIYRDLLSDKRPFEGFFLVADPTKEKREASPFSRIRRFLGIEDEKEKLEKSDSADVPDLSTAERIRRFFHGLICEHAPVEDLVREYPVELAYALALISTDDRSSVTPAWVSCRMPAVEEVMSTLRSRPCKEGCSYCREKLDPKANLKRFFGFEGFRLYGGEPLQERAVRAAVAGESLLAIFPTGGGKSLTFQLPALMAGQTARGLTVVISPLQSLMKDQVDHLVAAGISEAVTINGQLDPVERAKAYELIVDGTASLLYIAPETLRSKTMRRALLTRHIERFVIDEAHCFSAWGQDFRVDYLFIADFIAALSKEKGGIPIPVSCFTATAKRKVIQDICDYFKEKLDLKLTIYATSAARTNLHYRVIETADEKEKYARLRELLESHDCPAIVYTSTVRDTYVLAKRLTEDGLFALAYNGKMNSPERARNQNDFISGAARIIVATNAFGMGVDKKDVGLVVHYSISASLENYVQEAGRGARDPDLEADCYVLFCEDDLEMHFQIINNSRLSLKEIKDIWRGVKELSRGRGAFTSSALEIARAAGLNDAALSDNQEIETKIRSALAALEDAGYIKREMNAPRVYATSIQVRTLMEGKDIIERSKDFPTDEMRTHAVRILGSLISASRTSQATQGEAETRVDYLSDRLGIPKSAVVSAISAMRMAGVLKDDNDMKAVVSGSSRKAQRVLAETLALEAYLIAAVNELKARAEAEGVEWAEDDDGTDEADWADWTEETQESQENQNQTKGQKQQKQQKQQGPRKRPLTLSLKELNMRAQEAGCTASVKAIRTIFHYWRIAGLLNGLANAGEQCVQIVPARRFEKLAASHEARKALCSWILQWLCDHAASPAAEGDEKKPAPGRASREAGSETDFSLVGLMKRYKSEQLLAGGTTLSDVRDALLFLSKTGVITLEGGFMVIYNAMTIKRLNLDNRSQYRKEDYRKLDAYYKQKIQQVHIIGRYVALLLRDYGEALQFVRDYFEMDYRVFVKRYFEDDDAILSQPVGKKLKERIYGGLSAVQRAIIDDKESQFIAVAAGPGSGKTRVLVHKIASLLLLEGVKREQLLVLTFSRAAATVFKQRLIELIGTAAHYAPIKTFHSFAFDLMGRLGNLDESAGAVAQATKMIAENMVEPSRISKSVVVIDEAQDMNAEDYALVKALIERNPDMRVIAVGDDDQNVYEFRGSDPANFRGFAQHHATRCYEMPENYRSAAPIVALANRFAADIRERMKHEPLRAANDTAGRIAVIDYRSKLLAQPIVEAIAREMKEAKEAQQAQEKTEADGSAEKKGSRKGARKNARTYAVLTHTNVEAQEVHAALIQAGIRATLVEGSREFALYNLLEVRAFLKAIDKRRGDSPVLKHEDITEACTETCRHYGKTRATRLVENLTALFLSISPTETVYYSDLVEFIRETRFEDLQRDAAAPVTVCTIHKAKGTEFDSVHVWLTPERMDDEARRRIFVAITRAREALTIHEAAPFTLFTSLLQGTKDKDLAGTQILSDDKAWERPEKIVLELTLRDVNLGFYKGKKALICSVRTGSDMRGPDKHGIFRVVVNDRTAGSRRTLFVAQLSRAGRKHLERLNAIGYGVHSVTAGAIVAWLDKDTGNEEAVLIPRLTLVRTNTNTGGAS